MSQLANQANLKSVSGRSDTLLTSEDKSEIVLNIKKGNFKKALMILDYYRTNHAGTSKTKDKRFVIKEIEKSIIDKNVLTDKKFYETGKLIIDMGSDNSKEVGVSMIWRGYNHKRKNAEKYLIKIADDINWEVREYAAGAFASAVIHFDDFYDFSVRLTEHDSENVRRAVLFSALGLIKKSDPERAFELLQKLMHDSSYYVKRNLGPFILGSYALRKFTGKTMEFLKRCSRIDDKNVKWNVIMTFRNSFGLNNPGHAFEILKEFRSEKDKNVLRTVNSLLNYLSGQNRDLVFDFKEKNGFGNKIKKSRK